MSFNRHLKKILLFTSVITLLFSICIAIYNHPSFNKGKSAYLSIIDTIPVTDANLLILGDSHAYHAFPNDILNIHNILTVAYPGEGLTEMFLKLQYAKTHIHKLQAIIIPIDYHDFSTYRAQFTNKSYGLYYADRHIYNATYNESYHPMQYLLYQKLPLLEPSQRTDFVRKMINKIVSYRHKNNQNALAEKTTWSTEITDSEYHRIARQLGGDLTVQTLIDTKRKIIDFAHSHDIIVIGIRFPIAPEYREIAKQFNIDEVEVVQQTLPHDLVLDYRTVFDDNPEYFLNVDHVNSLGAAALSSILVHDVRTHYPELLP